ncbi:MAG TPA: histidine kinase [Candidatus Dormibacteraeota bacterium]|nr:histidine kinase [Candidatus Dormibacteraeota bacterium]
MTEAKGKAHPAEAGPSVAAPAGDAGAGGSVGDAGGVDGEAAAPARVSVPELAEVAEAELVKLDRELAEIELLVAQARTEAGRHESRRAQAAEKLAAAKPEPKADTRADAKGEAKADPKEALELANQLVTLTKRATIMESQVEVLEGKQRALARYRETLGRQATALRTLAEGVAETWMPVEAPQVTEGTPISAEAEAAGLPPAISRVVLAAQEDLRREIARAMHDGPAQSLTNIVLQAQIVERLLQRDPAAAKRELGLLGEMVQHTLDATKSFIFEVRPMVLDDLGLVPTLRRSARERGRKAGLTVAFDSVGADRRLGVDLESSLFRIVDEALVAYLERGPELVSIELDWNSRLRIEVAASRGSTADEAEDAAAPAPGADVPPALAAMIEDRRAKARAAAPGPISLPPNAWREIQGRARTVGVTAELLDDGGRLVLEAPLPEGG